MYHSTYTMKLLPFVFLLLFTIELSAQTSFCLDDPPKNPFLADSPWPIYHRNNYAQASTCLTGPLPGDSLRIKAKTEIQGGTSPWVYLSDTYPGGQRALLYSNATHVFKLIDEGDKIVTADSLRIDFDPIASFGWNFLLTKDRIWYTYDPKYDPESGQSTKLIKLTDTDPNDPYSDIIELDRFDFGDYDINRVQHFSLNYNGQIVFNSENDESKGYATIGIISPDLELLDTLRYPTEPREIVHHNAFPIDEDNSFYIVTTSRLICFGWDGAKLSKMWEAAYDFVNDGPTGSFAEGSGTTPSLMGWGEGNDQLVVLADGHAQNNLVAFWRDLPTDWTGIPGEDIRLAGKIQIPNASSFSNTFQSIENSPTVHDYSVAIAQFNGFLGYDCENVKGVQKFTWDQQLNRFQLDWTNDQLNMNGVLTYSSGANLLYGSGKEEDCHYYYYGLNWDTGELELRQLLGPEGTFLNDPFYDAGNANIIDEEGSIYFPGGGSLVKVEIVQRAVSSTNNRGKEISYFTPTPNPARSFLQLPIADPENYSIQIHNVKGELLYQEISQPVLNIEWLPAGLYFITLKKGGEQQIGKFVKQ